MAYFKNFPKVGYIFQGEPAVMTNLSVYAEVIDEIRLSSSFYQDYYIKNGERPDHIAYKMYDNPQLYWVFYLMNPKLREQGWPMSQEEVMTKVKRDHPNQTFRFITNTPSKLHVGQEIEGYTSGSKATILHINLDLGQVTVDSNESFATDQLIKLVENNLTYSFFSIESEHLAAHHYTLNGEIVDINPYLPVPVDHVKVTNSDFYISENDKLKQIRVIKPRNINTVVNAFRDAIR